MPAPNIAAPRRAETAGNVTARNVTARNVTARNVTAGNVTAAAIFTVVACLPGGGTHILRAPAGWRLMEVLRDYGLPIRAECGGACACATCHVRITGTGTEIGAGRVALSPPEDDELDRLAEMFDADDSSRLACQILTGPQTDGLVVTLAADSMLAEGR